MTHTTCGRPTDSPPASQPATLTDPPQRGFRNTDPPKSPDGREVDGEVGQDAEHPHTKVSGCQVSQEQIRSSAHTLAVGEDNEYDDVAWKQKQKQKSGYRMQQK